MMKPRIFQFHLEDYLRVLNGMDSIDARKMENCWNGKKMNEDESKYSQTPAIIFPLALSC